MLNTDDEMTNLESVNTDNKIRVLESVNTDSENAVLLSFENRRSPTRPSSRTSPAMLVSCCQQTHSLQNELLRRR